LINSDNTNLLYVYVYVYVYMTRQNRAEARFWLARAPYPRPPPVCTHHPSTPAPGPRLSDRPRKPRRWPNGLTIWLLHIDFKAEIQGTGSRSWY